MRRARIVATVACAALLAACGGSPRPDPSSSPSPTPTATPSPSPTPSPDPTLVAFAASLEGTYDGTWDNTTFGSTGPATMTVDFVEEDGVLAVTIDVDGGVFGGIDPPALGVEGALVDRAISFVASSDAFGTITATIAPDGRVDSSLDDVPGDRVASVEVSGAFTASDVRLAYTVAFEDDSSAAGTFDLTKSS